MSCTKPAPNAVHKTPGHHHEACDHPPTAVRDSRSGLGGGTVLHIPAMDCAVEEGALRRALEPIAGIRALRFKLGSRTLAIDADAQALPAALRAIEAAGFDAQPLAADASDGPHGHAEGAGLARLGAALLLALGSEAVHWFAADVPVMKWLGLGLAAVAIWLAGIDVYRNGVRALARGKLNINALMSVAVTGAFVLGQWPEAAMVMALYALAEWIEARAAGRARNAIESLVALAPEQAEVQQDDGRWRVVPSAEVALDALVRIRPGERVPLDGIITHGSSAIDQAAVTGESLPVERTVGGALFAGTINLTGELTFRVSATASGTTLARIIHAVEQAQATRAPTQRFVDRFAAIYTPRCSRWPSASRLRCRSCSARRGWTRSTRRWCCW